MKPKKRKLNENRGKLKFFAEIGRKFMMFWEIGVNMQYASLT